MNRRSLFLLGFIQICAFSIGVAADVPQAAPAVRPAAPVVENVIPRDSSGNTPLHLAALRSDADAVDALLKQGGDPAAVNAAGATALHYGVTNERIVAALLAHGAPVDAVSKLGMTPLLEAVACSDSYGVVQQLVSAGANVNHQRVPTRVADPGVLATAIRAGDRRTIAFLLDHGANVTPAAGIWPLTVAASAGDLETAKRLLELGAPVNPDSSTVPAPLSLAARSRRVEVAQLLLENGANPATVLIDRRRTPAIVFSGYVDDDNPAMARLLLAHGADINQADEYGDTALTYALKRGPDTPLVTYLREAGGTTSPRPPRTKVIPARAVPAEDSAREKMVRDAAQRAINVIQPSSRAFLTNPRVHVETQCTSCHHQSLPAVGFALARERGLHVDPLELERTMFAMNAELVARAEDARQMIEVFQNMRVTLGYQLDGLHALGYPPSDTTDAMTRALLARQEADGGWKANVPRGPMEDQYLSGTAWSVRAIQLYPPRGREAQAKQALQRAQRWLEAQHPVLFNDQVLQLLGLAWTNATTEQMESFATRMISAQRLDGGWAQLPGLPCDAWATGSALVALHKAGVPTSHDAYRRGVDFLLRTQFDDGSWWVRSRSWATQAHFDGKFPHGKDQWISAAGTSWAMIALLLTVEPTKDAATFPQAPELIAAFAASPAAVASPPRDSRVAESNAKDAVDFAHDIQPILERSCVKCHGGERPRGAFSLTSRATLLKGGQSGEPAVVPGYAEDSKLIHYVSDEVEDLEMPPLNRREKYPPLSREEVELLQNWIDAGAPWPAATNKDVATLAR